MFVALCQRCGCILRVTYISNAVKLLVEALRYKPQGRGFDSPWDLNFSGRTVDVGVDSASNKNGYQVIYPWGRGGGVKAAGLYGWQFRHLHVPVD